MGRGKIPTHMEGTAVGASASSSSRSSRSAAKSGNLLVDIPSRSGFAGPSEASSSSGGFVRARGDDGDGGSVSAARSTRRGGPMRDTRRLMTDTRGAMGGSELPSLGGGGDAFAAESMKEAHRGHGRQVPLNPPPGEDQQWDTSATPAAHAAHVRQSSYVVAGGAALSGGKIVTTIFDLDEMYGPEISTWQRSSRRVSAFCSPLCCCCCRPNYRQSRKRPPLHKYLCLSLLALLLAVACGYGGWRAFLSVRKMVRARSSRFQIDRDGYRVARSKSLLFLEAQRSGKLPPDNRVPWRGDSGLMDGDDVGRDLSGGYYDAGDNVKFHFPMAFTMTMLSWSVAEYGTAFGDDLRPALLAIKWGTDYLLRSWDRDSQVLFVQVGDPVSDHNCWERPETMSTKRTTYSVSALSPGSDVAGEVSASLAAASIAFTSFALQRQIQNQTEAYSPDIGVDDEYIKSLLQTSSELCDFAMRYQARYSESVPAAELYNSTSGYQDEILWCNAWHYRATGNSSYLEYLTSAAVQKNIYDISEMNWDNKMAGVSVLLATLEPRLKADLTPGMARGVRKFANLAEVFVCSHSNGSGHLTPAGLLWTRPWNPIQYSATAAFLVQVYSDHLSSSGAEFDPEWCGTSSVRQSHAWVRSQAEYVLGKNDEKMSYMVGFGKKFPRYVHHRGASIGLPGLNSQPEAYTCQGGKEYWYNSKKPNPNVIEGAIVGGPDQNDKFKDSRSNFYGNEPTLYNAGCFAGVFARLSDPTYRGISVL